MLTWTQYFGVQNNFDNLITQTIFFIEGALATDRVDDTNSYSNPKLTHTLFVFLKFPKHRKLTQNLQRNQ